MMERTKITDRIGRTVSQATIDKAIRLADRVHPTNLDTVWDVDGDTGRYRVLIDQGLSYCSCPGGLEGTLCSHQLAVWVNRDLAGDPVHVSRIDGPRPSLSVVPDDPFAGLV